LNADSREILFLRFIEGFREREIAEILDIPLGTVKSRTHAALKKLKRLAAEIKQQGVITDDG
jgi:RNA polymerase sigma-70 factor (ECF subfamily)